MSSRFDKLELDGLTRFGFTDLQAKVYVAFYLQGEVPVKEIVKWCQMHRTEVYRVVRELERMGVIVPVVSRPVRYRALPPEEVLKDLLVPQLERLSELGERKAEILDRLASEKRKNGLDGQSDDGFEILRGGQVLKRIEGMIDRASQEILYRSREFRESVDTGLLKAFERALKRGVKARGVLNVTKQNLETVRRLRRSRLVSKRHSDCAYSWMVIVDAREMVFSSAPNALPDEEFLYTRNRRFIGHSVRSFDLQFGDAVPLEDRVRELGKAHGA